MPMLALCWPYVGLSWPHVGPCWPQVGPSWAYVGPMLAYLGPMLACLGPRLAHLGAYVGASLAVVWVIYVETPSRCQLFRFSPLPGAQIHVKTTVFALRQL